MVYIFIQLLLNVIIFVALPKPMIGAYKKMAYIMYPVLISILLLVRRGQVINGLNGDGIVLDITDLYSKWHLLTLAMIILVQFICNNFLHKFVRRLLVHK